MLALTTLLKRARTRAEQAYLAAARRSVLRSKHGARADALKRSAHCTDGQGFAPFRQRWWQQWRFEPLRNRLRYIALCERARTMNALDDPDERSGSVVQTRKISFIQFGHLGDLVHTIPALRNLRRAMLGAEVTLLTGPWNREIAGRIPYVDRVLCLAPRWESYLRGCSDLCQGVRKEWEFALSLRREDLDIVVDCTSGSMLTLFLMLAIRPRMGIGPELFPGGDFQPPSWYRSVPYESRRYEASRLLGLLSSLGISTDDVVLEFPLTESDRREGAALLERRGISITDPFVMLAPGAGWPGKMWPAERFGELGKRIQRQLDSPVLVIGTRSERCLADAVVRRVEKRAFNVAGETSLGALGALLERARVLVTNDSGPYHIATALNTPTVLLFGPGSVTKWAQTSSPRQRILQHDIGCRCFPWHPRARCDYDRACMRAISVDEAWKAVTELLR